METKTCKCCGNKLPVSEFAKSARSKDGYQHICYSCKARNTVKQKYYDERLSSFTALQLIKELKARGYVGTLYFTQKIDINKI